MSNFHWIIDGLFVSTVALIWFMLGYQSLLFFLGHIYYRRTRHAAKNLPEVPDAELPCISVLVPCHNEGRVIAHTINALQKLDYPSNKIEFLLINDGSTDNTAEVIRGFAADPRVRLLEVPAPLSARGKSGALNYALSQARHPLIAIYDADNLPEARRPSPPGRAACAQSQAGSGGGDVPRLEPAPRPHHAICQY